jgi:chromosome partitioning protein
MATATPSDQLTGRIEALRKRGAVDLRRKIIAIMSGKGGVGKTLTAEELAWLFDAVLVDLDWDEGNATVSLGYIPDKYMRAPLLDALRTGRTPVPKRGRRRPDLVPCHPDFFTAQPPAEAMRDALIQWAHDWDRAVVVDTHPGGNDAMFGAVGAADSILCLTTLATRPLNALNGMMKELGSYPLMVIPNEVSGIPPAAEINRLDSITRTYDVPVGPMISRYSWYQTRKLRTVVTAAPEISIRTRPLVAELVTLAEAVAEHALA